MYFQHDDNDDGYQGHAPIEFLTEDFARGRYLEPEPEPEEPVNREPRYGGILGRGMSMTALYPEDRVDYDKPKTWAEVNQKTDWTEVDKIVRLASDALKTTIPNLPKARAATLKVAETRAVKNLNDWYGNRPLNNTSGNPLPITDERMRAWMAKGFAPLKAFMDVLTRKREAVYNQAEAQRVQVGNPYVKNLYQQVNTLNGIGRLLVGCGRGLGVLFYGIYLALEGQYPQNPTFGNARKYFGNLCESLPA